MEQPTRRLLSLLAAELTDAILERLARKPASKTELASELGASSRDIAAKLDLLLLAGLVRHHREKSPGAGPPREVWELVGGNELNELEDYVLAMRHRLIDA